MNSKNILIAYSCATDLSAERVLNWSPTVKGHGGIISGSLLLSILETKMCAGRDMLSFVTGVCVGLVNVCGMVGYFWILKFGLAISVISSNFRAIFEFFPLFNITVHFRDIGAHENIFVNLPHRKSTSFIFQNIGRWKKEYITPRPQRKIGQHHHAFLENSYSFIPSLLIIIPEVRDQYPC